MKQWCASLALFVLLGLSSGCGYTFRGGGSVLPPDVHKIYIPIVENNSTEIGLSDVVTEALREEFDSYGVVTVVENRSDADAILSVKILSLKRSTKTVRARNNTALALETTLDLAAELRRSTGPVLWRSSDFRISKGFGTDPSSVVTSSTDFATGSLSSADLSNLTTRDIARGQEQEALNVIAEEAARKIYDQAVSPDF
jgi:outer membrane lipopolysaccharide assembly protein LptE/RlpB